MHSNQPLEMYTMQISSQRYCLFLIRASILLHFFVKKQQDVHFSHVFMQDFDVYTLKSGTIRHKNMFYNIKTRLDNRYSCCHFFAVNANEVNWANWVNWTN